MISSRTNILSAMQRGARIIREDGRYLLSAEWMERDKEISRTAFSAMLTEGVIQKDWDDYGSEAWKFAAKPDRYVVFFRNGDVRECELVDGVFEHVLHRGFQIAEDDARIRSAKKVK